MSAQKLTLEDLQDLFSNAIQSDLEHGVAWMNDEAAKKFAVGYPELNRAIGVLMMLDGLSFRIVVRGNSQDGIFPVLTDHVIINQPTEGA